MVEAFLKFVFEAVLNFVFEMVKKWLKKKKLKKKQKELINKLVFFSLLFIGLTLLAVCGKLVYEKFKKADPNKLAVIVTDFENDNTLADKTESKVKDVLRHDLEKEVPNAQVIPVNETLNLSGSIREEKIKESNQRAQEILKAKNGDLLIWGSIEKRDGVTSVDLFWTGLSRNNPFLENREYKIKDGHLSGVFLEDVDTYVRLIVTLRATDIFNKTQFYVADQAKELLEKAKVLFTKEESRKVKDKEFLQYQLLKANLLFVLGEQAGDKDALRNSTKILQEILKEKSENISPMDKDLINFDLANALSQLGQLQNDTLTIEDSLRVYADVLKSIDKEKMPLVWAGIENNLADTERFLAEKSDDLEKLKEVRKTLVEVIKEYPRDKYPNQWSSSQTDLANVLVAIGSREAVIVELQTAISLYLQVLKQVSKEDYPLEWAYNKTNLGMAYIDLWKIQDETSWKEEAVKAQKDALTVYNTENMPNECGDVQNNLGCIYQTICSRETNNITSNKIEALKAFQKAFGLGKRANNQLLWTCAGFNVGSVQGEMGNLNDEEEKIRESIKTYKEMIENENLNDPNINWGMIYCGLAQSLYLMYQKKNDENILIDIINTYQNCLKRISPRDIKNIIGVENGLGATLCNLAVVRRESKLLDDAKLVFREGLKKCNNYSEYKKIIEQNLELLKKEKVEIEHKQNPSPVKPFVCPLPNEINRFN